LFVVKRLLHALNSSRGGMVQDIWILCRGFTDDDVHIIRLHAQEVRSAADIVSKVHQIPAVRQI